MCDIKHIRTNNRSLRDFQKSDNLHDFLKKLSRENVFAVAADKILIFVDDELRKFSQEIIFANL